jgi:hypothetical protein
MYSVARKRQFGRFLHDFLRNPDMWTEDLHQWCEREDAPRQSHGGISIDTLLLHLSDRSNIDLGDPYYANLLGNWTRWHSHPHKGGDNAALIVALAQCQIFYWEEEVFSSPSDLVNWLLGC